MTDYKQMDKREMQNLMLDGEVLETRSGAELYYDDDTSQFLWTYGNGVKDPLRDWSAYCRIKPKTETRWKWLCQGLYVGVFLTSNHYTSEKNVTDVYDNAVTVLYKVQESAKEFEIESIAI